MALTPQSRALQSGTVTFDVRGMLVKVLPELICGKGDTLLAQLIQDVGTDVSQPIFVDANPHRFHHILDWYRYGEMFPTQSCSTAALLRDADYFLLPDEVVVNGEKQVLSRSTSHALGSERTAVRLRAEYIQDVIAKWPNFDAFFQERLADICGQIKASATRSDSEIELPSSDALAACVSSLRFSAAAKLELSEYDRQSYSGQTAWLFPANLHNSQRIEVFMAKLEECGFSCQTHSGHRHAPWTLAVRLPLQSGCGTGGVKQPLLVQAMCAYSGKPTCSGSPCLKAGLDSNHNC